jgi:hypothetical protein
MALSPTERRRVIVLREPEDNFVIGEEQIMLVLWIAEKDYIYPPLYSIFE